MSRGQSQSRSQPQRRVLERCKTLGDIEIIDVDKDADVIILDGPETSHRGSRGPRAATRNCCPNNGVISIDDEEGDTDDNLQNMHEFCAASSNSPSSEESRSAECLISTRKGAEHVTMYSNVGSSINRFGLGSTSTSTSQSSASESESNFSSQSIDTEDDSSDCEIIEDSSGNIREQWERAALRKRMSERGQYGSEDLASGSGSSGDPGILSEETTKNNIDDENCIHSPCSNHPDEIPTESSPNSPTNRKRDRSFDRPAVARHSSDSLSKNKANAYDADGVLHEEPSFQKNEHIPETCSYGARSADKTLSDDKSPAFQCPESCHSKVQRETNVRDDGNSFIDIDERTPNENCSGTDELHGESSFQGAVRHSRKSSPCAPQPQDGEHVSPDNASLHDKREHFHGEPLCLNHSQCASVVGPENGGFQVNEKSGIKEPSLRDAAQLNTDEEAVLEEPTVCNSHSGSKTARRFSLQPGREDTSQVENDLICERERHKESDEYRHAVEEEWASRQRQLQIQAEEAQRLRRRRKAETLRQLEMEKRQKQRLEEIRESQKKDEETINLKEHFRGEVRKELDKMELRYKDMASLLRGLGIHVEGGRFPMPSEVNAAYKQALLRFHPDRASRTDIRQQVEAEEIFKLISRLKTKLLS